MKSNIVALLIILFGWGGETVISQREQRGSVTDAVIMRAKLYEPLIISAAERHQIDPHLLWTIAYLESGFRKEAVSYKNGKPCAYGLMQFTVPTALQYGLTNPHDPQQSIDAAARYVRDLQRRFGPRTDLILAAYNAGEGTVEAFRDGKALALPNKRVINPNRLQTNGIPPYRETRNYVARGVVIYSQTTRDAVFTRSASSANSTEKSNAPMAEPTRQNSIYSLDAASIPLAANTVKSVKTTVTFKSSKSIYAN
jgi:membrane-bound lytic murein transglycosylase MltF